MKSLDLRIPSEAPVSSLPKWGRHMIVTIFGEFCGTFMFLFLSFVGAQTAIDANDPRDPEAPLMPFSLMYIAASFGTSLAISVWVFFRVTGGMFNPAVTLALILTSVVKPLAGLVIVLTQMVAAIAAAAVVDAIIPGPLSVNNRLTSGTNVPQGLFLEMFITAPLVLAVLFLAVEKHRSTYLAPIGIGIAAFIAHIAGTRYDGTSINPARSFGPDVIVGFTTYHWIFWLGPALGSVLAVCIYEVLKWFRYEYVNPAQDAIDIETAARALEAAKTADLESRSVSQASRPTTQASPTSQAFRAGDTAP